MGIDQPGHEEGHALHRPALGRQRGAMVALGGADTVLEQAIGFFAVALGAANAAGGYVVTDRMLAMFKKKEGAQ